MSSGGSPHQPSSRSITGISKRCPVQFASLSRNALYTSLNAYIESSETKKIQKSIKSNIREKSLYSFLEAVSVEHHSPTSMLGKIGGANGGRPLNSKHMEKKVSQRALTLIGGGCDSSTFAKSTTEMVCAENGRGVSEVSLPSSKKRNKSLHFVHGSLPKRRRRKLAMTRKQKSSSKIMRPDTKEQVNLNQSAYTKEILVQLNQMWNQYINSLLKQRYTHMKTESIKKQEIATLLSTAEMIGSYVIIVSTSNSLSDRVGIIVDVTKNTWRIASPLNKMMNKESKNTCSIKVVKDDAKWKVLVVPKEKSSLVCCIQLDQNDRDRDAKQLYVRISAER